MPQEMQVLKCFSCETFQVHIVKKSLKWECKVCGEKQSIKKVYGRGSGKDCRILVQELNRKRLELNHEPSVNESGYEFYSSPKNICKDQFSNVNAEPNRWVEFTCTATTDKASIQTENDDISSYTFERPIKRSKYHLSDTKHSGKDEESLENETQNILSVKNQWKKCTDTATVKGNEVFSKFKSEQCIPSKLIQKTTALDKKLQMKKVDTKDSCLAPNFVSFAEAKNSKWAQFISTSTSSNLEDKIHNFQDIGDLNTTALNEILNYSRKNRANDLCLQPHSSKWNNDFISGKGQLIQNEILTNASLKHIEDTSSSIEFNSEKPLNAFFTPENDLDSILTF